MTFPLVIRTASAAVEPADALVLYAHETEAPRGGAAALWGRTGLDWAAVAVSAGFKGKQGQILDLIAPPNLSHKRLMVLGTGPVPAESEAPVASAWTDRGGSLMAKLGVLKGGTVAVLLDEPGTTPALVAELVAGLRLRHYRFDRYKTRKPDEAEGDGITVTLHVANAAACSEAILERSASIEGTLLARDLVNEPANMLGPLEFAARLEKFADLGLEVDVLEPEAMAELGMNALLAVGRGSRRPPRLVVLRWNGGGDEAPLAVVGKGVMFDSGGISIKPAGSMEDMKGDMGGAAAVAGLMHSLAVRRAGANVVGIVGLAENMPDGAAMRPSDILCAMSGTTIEVVNTDAEGRLVLADALHYAIDRFKPKAVIDLATLTGAVIVALGHDHAGLFSNDEELASALVSAGLSVNEKVWRLPLSPAYDKLIESKFADIKNSGGRPAGSITAAQFLKRFVGETKWAHLDIAGTAFGAPASETNASWGSGFGVALLDRLVRDRYER